MAIRVLMAIAVWVFLAYGISMVTKKSIEDTIPLSASGIIVVMYIAGFFGNLKIGFYAVLLIALIGVFYCIYALVTNKIKLHKRMYSLAFFIFVCWILVMYSKRMLCVWDEFSHWGLAAKIMFSTNKFANESGTTLLFKDYPPGTALFQYFMLQFCPTYNEAVLSIAYGTLMFSFFLPVFARIENKKYIFLTAFCLYMIPLGFYESAYVMIYVDAILGVIFASLVYQYISESKRDLYFYIKLSLETTVLCLVKSSGIGLASLFFIIVITDDMMKKQNVRYKLVEIGKAIITFLVAFFFRRIWSMRVERLGYTAMFNTEKITLPEIVKVFMGKGEEYQTNTILNFIKEYFGIHRSGIVFEGLVCYIFVFVVFCYMLYKITNGEKKRYIALAVTTSLTFLIYSFYMLCLYLFTFSAQEAQELASFHRYEYTIVMGILLALIMLCMVNFAECGIKEKNFLKIGIVCLAFICPIPINFVINLFQANQTIKFREQFSEIENVSSNLTSKDKVYMVQQGSTNNSVEHFAVKYIVDPAYISSEMGNLGVNDPEGQAVSWEISAEEWMQYLIDNSFTYVYLQEIDQHFLLEYGKLFEKEAQKGKVYRIDNEEKLLKDM